MKHLIVKDTFHGAVSKISSPVSKQRNKTITTKGRAFAHLGFSAIALAVLSGCGGGGSSGGGGGSGSTPPPPVNNPPVVSADEQRLVSAGDAVTLTASATDPEADSIAYSWEQLNGEAVANTDGFSTASASFNAPDKVDTIVFRVTATAAGQSDTTEVRLIVVEDVDTAVFVDADFSGTATGQIDAPFTDLNQAITDAERGTDFYIKTPSNNASYSLWDLDTSPPVLREGMSIYGAYTSDWQRDVANNKTPVEASFIGFSYQEVDVPTTLSGMDITVNQGKLTDTINVGVYVGSGSSEFTLADNTIQVLGYPENEITPNTGSTNIYGFYSTRLDTVNVLNNNVTAGMGLKAPNRITRTTGVGADGVDGQNANVGNNTTGGAGGGVAGSGWNGGRGGDAGTAIGGEAGSDGSAGSGRSSPVVISGGSGGAGGLDQTNARDGLSGSDGAIPWR